MMQPQMSCSGAHSAEWLCSMFRTSDAFSFELTSQQLNLITIKCVARSFGWDNVEVVCADACTFQPQEKAHLLTFSYSLSMMPPFHAGAGSRQAFNAIFMVPKYVRFVNCAVLYFIWAGHSCW